MKGVLEKIGGVCVSGPATPLPLIFAGDTWQTALVLGPSYLHTSSRFRLACRALLDEFERLPDEKLFKEFVASGRVPDMDAIAEKIMTIKTDKCKECSKKIQDYFRGFTGSYGDYYDVVCRVHAQIDNNETMAQCKCFAETYGVLRCRYSDAYYSRVDEAKNVVAAFMDDETLSEDMAFVAFEYWDRETRDFKIFIRTSVQRIARAKIPKVGLIGYVLAGKDLKRYSHYVTIDDELKGYIERITK